ncbi:cytochrome P450 [Pendulispora brunnea]|uniref:Cytochrome P450 n=1 Tax=Pendulispora brunnea TaxID=2905690 RepID=A0ABZ2K1R9_9BACT
MSMSNVSVTPSGCPMHQVSEADLSIKNLIMKRELHADPSGFFRTLRETDPLHWDPDMNAWMATTYEAALAILKDPRVGSMPTKSLEEARKQGGAEAERFYHLLSKNILFMNPPEHTRLRKLINAGFKPSVLQKMRQVTRELTHAIMDRVQPTGKMDVVADLSRPIPAMIIARLLGAPDGDHDRFRKWGDAAVELIQMVSIEDERFMPLLRKGLEYYDYMGGLIKRFRAAPGEGFLHELIAAVDADPNLDDEDLIANSRAILTGGHQTTADAIGAGLYILLKHPEQLKMLREDPSLMPAAVEELMRFLSPVVLHPRRAMEDMELQGKSIKKGQIIFAVPAAANRDPKAFPDPEKFDITRAKKLNLAFGQSVHYCVGAPLARIELEETYSVVLERLPDLQIDGDVDWFFRFPMRGLNKFNVTF